ncbi:MAG TPA: hypothetical protein VG206_23110 [Terriglobia bacterium]|nr:hypothetical protein [Terriglobia bacterium]
MKLKQLGLQWGARRMTKQEKERYYFEMFRSDYSLPDGNVEYGDRPDVVLRGDKKIGIEITNLFHQDGSLCESEQRQRILRSEVVSKAHHIYRGRHGRRFKLSFSFDKAIPIHDPDDLAEKMAKLAASVESKPTGSLWRDVFRHIPELDFIYLNANEYEDSRWRVSQGHTVPRVSVSRLKEVITAKETKCREYRPCDSYWLLVIVDFMDRAQDQQFWADDFNDVASDFFERIVLYKTLTREVLERRRGTD